MSIKRSPIMLAILFAFLVSLLMLQPLQSRERIQGNVRLGVDWGFKPKSKKHKILTYITTHLSDGHREFLKHCWPNLLNRLPLFQKSDFMMFITKDQFDDDKAFIESVFGE